MDERRQLPRWEIRKGTKVWRPQAQRFNEGVIEDMHLKGMCLSFDEPVFDSAEVSIYFTIGNTLDLIKVEAEIPWQRQAQGKYVYGLCFTQIRDDYKDKISEYVNTHCYEQIKNKWWE